MPRVSSARRGGSSNRFDKEGGRGGEMGFPIEVFFSFNAKVCRAAFDEMLCRLDEGFSKFPRPFPPLGKIVAVRGKQCAAAEFR